MWDSLGKISGFAFGALDVQALLPGLADANVVPGRRALFADCRALFGFSILALLVTQARTPGVALQTLHDLPATRPAAPPAPGHRPHTVPHALPQVVNQIGYVEPPPHPDARAERLGHPLRLGLGLALGLALGLGLG